MLIRNAYELINANDITKNMSELNHQKYEYLKDGIPVSYKDEDGELVLATPESL